MVAGQPLISGCFLRATSIPLEELMKLQEDIEWPEVTTRRARAPGGRAEFFRGRGQNRGIPGWLGLVNSPPINSASCFSGLVFVFYLGGRFGC